MGLQAHKSVGRAGEELFGEGEKIPFDLGMDLLVDGELSDQQRRAFLKMLDAGSTRDHTRWRELSLRFLQRQCEKETTRQLLAGGSLLPVEFVPATRGRRLWSCMLDPRSMAVAAGLLIATISSLLTLLVFRPIEAPGSHTTVARIDPDTHTNFTPNVVGIEGQPLTIPIVAAPQEKGASVLFPVGNGEENIKKQSTVIQSDGKGNAVVIRVDTLNMAVY